VESYGELAGFDIVRHGRSEFNELGPKKNRDPLYRKFSEAYNLDWRSQETFRLALAVKQKFFLPYSQNHTPITEEGMRQARIAGAGLKDVISLPDAVVISPSPRTMDTFECMKEGWPELGEVREVFCDERIREQEHGFMTLFNDMKVFFALHPWQRELYELDGDYFFRFPNGENAPDAKLRLGLWLEDMRKRFANKYVLAVAHFRIILCLRMILEGFDSEEFTRIDREEGPINCGVTMYRKEPARGKFGKLGLVCYNKKLYD